MAALDAADAATPEDLNVFVRPEISELTAHTLYLCGAHDRVLEIARDEVASRPDDVAPHRELFWCVLAACVCLLRGELRWEELPTLDAWRGPGRVHATRLGLLLARFALECGDLECGDLDRVKGAFLCCYGFPHRGRWCSEIHTNRMKGMSCHLLWPWQNFAVKTLTQ